MSNKSYIDRPLEYTDTYGDTFEVYPEFNMYKNNNLYLALHAYDEDLGYIDAYCDVTVNIDPLNYLYSAIDTTYNGENIMKFLENSGLAVKTNQVLYSGFGKYPVFKFNEEKIKEFAPDFFKEYSKAYRAELSNEMINKYIDAIYDYNELSKKIKYMNESGYDLTDVHFALPFDYRIKDSIVKTKFKSIGVRFFENEQGVVIDDKSIDLLDDYRFIGTSSLENIYASVVENGLEDLFRRLQENEYNWPNIYLAWEKPDKSIYMIGVVSGQMGEILEYEEKDGKTLRSHYTSISSYISHRDKYGQYDPVKRICDNVKEYKYIGGWNDSCQLIEGVSTKVLAKGRWEEAKKYIFRNENPSLDSMISNIEKTKSKEVKSTKIKEDFIDR